MSNEPMFSIIVPTWNADLYLDATLRSVIMQQWRGVPGNSIEVIVVDAGSTDQTQPISLAAGIENLEWIDAPGLNQAAAINLGFQRASGQILSWLNADDILWPGALARVQEFFESNDEARFVYGHAVAMDSAGRCHGRRRHVREGGHKDLIDDDFIVQPASFWRRELWETHGPLRHDFEFVFDYEFFLRVSAQEPLSFIDVPLAGERLHGATKTAGGGIPRIRELERLMRLHAGRDEVPASFSGEAASVHIREAGRLLRAGRGIAASRAVRQAKTLRTQPIAGAVRTLAAAPVGERGYLRALLIFNAAEAVLRGESLNPE